MREPRTTKSFRDAGDRIVREDSALPPSISRLLGAPALSARSGTTDADAWDVRLAAFATLAQYDGLTFVNLASSDPSVAYNLVEDPTTDPAIRGAVDEVSRSAVTAQLRASVRLADGRLASAVLVTPLAPSEGFAGALVAFRVGRQFAAVDAHTAVGIAEIVSLELARSIDSQDRAVDLGEDAPVQVLPVGPTLRHLFQRRGRTLLLSVVPPRRSFEHAPGLPRRRG